MVHESVLSCLPHAECYFAACNTPDGFASLFADIFSPRVLSRIFILKGGPGTGKSSMMRQIAKAAEEKGHRVTYYYCSSDTDSLDGIVIRDIGTAVLDGTAPHMTDPLYPGAVEQIVNLGQFFDVPQLRYHREQIARYGKLQKKLYQRVYTYLKNADNCMQICRQICAQAFLQEKAQGAVERLLRKIPHSGEPVYEKAYVTAIGTKGIVHFETFDRMAEKKIYVINGHGGEALLFSLLEKSLKKKGISHTRLIAPENPNGAEGFWLPQAKLLIRLHRGETICAEDKTLNMERFYCSEMLREEKAALRQSRGEAVRARALALGLLAQIADVHTRLEAIYIAAMDFSGVQQNTEDLIKALPL